MRQAQRRQKQRAWEMQSDRTGGGRDTEEERRVEGPERRRGTAQIGTGKEH